MRRLWRFPFHPFLLALFAVFALYAANLGQVVLAEAVRPAAVVVVLAAVVVSFSWLIYRDLGKAGLAASLFLVIFLFYGHVHEALWDWLGPQWLVSRNRVLMPAMLALLLVGLIWVKKERGGAGAWTGRLNLLTACILGVSLAQILWFDLRAPKIAGPEVAAPATRPADASYPDAPDIYYIILDAYPNSRVLKDYYDHDNGAFIEALRAMNFHVSADSRSNYPHSRLSLASSLNMDYINSSADRPGRLSRTDDLLSRMIRHSKIRDLLRRQGYRYVLFRSGWGPTDRGNPSDTVIRTGRTNEFEEMVLKTSLLSPLAPRLAFYDHRLRIRRTLSGLADMPRTAGPKFVFAHIVCPHGPYVFGPKGEAIEGQLAYKGNVWLCRKEYIGQVEFISNAVLPVLARIIRDSRVPPVIVLQGDHGPTTSRSPDFTGALTLTPDCVNARCHILNALHLPGVPPDRLSDTMTPVNSFRLVLSHYLGLDFPPLQDKVYFTGDDLLVEFEDVTDWAN